MSSVTTYRVPTPKRDRWRPALAATAAGALLLSAAGTPGMHGPAPTTEPARPAAGAVSQSAYPTQALATKPAAAVTSAGSPKAYIGLFKDNAVGVLDTGS